MSLLMGIIKNSQSTQNNKFAIFLQYLKKEVRDGVHFSACRKGSKLLQVDIIDFAGRGQTCFIIYLFTKR